MLQGATQIDVIEELKLRRWARENYVPAPQRVRSWHPVVLDEMRLKDDEKKMPHSANQNQI